MRQSDPPNSINYLVVDDIVETALRRLDERLGIPTCVSGEDNGVYANNNNRYADDSLCPSYKADIF